MRLSHEKRRERRKRIAEFCEDNSQADAAVEFGVSMSMVQTVCREYGIGSQPRPVAARTLEILADLLRTELTYQSIADKHGVTRQAVGQVADRARAAGIHLDSRRARASKEAASS